MLTPVYVTPFLALLSGFYFTTLLFILIIDDRHLSSLITCSVKVCYDYYELNN
jgi:hypothetical protein